MTHDTIPPAQKRETCRDCGTEVTSDVQSQHVFGLCDGCERSRVERFPKLCRHLSSIVVTAKAVSAAWESGDLAAAVRELGRIATVSEVALAGTPAKPSRSPTRAGDGRPWTAEPSADGFFRVVNADSVILADRCVREEALLFAAAKDLADALDRLLAQTVDMDLAHGIALTEGEAEARAFALAVLDNAHGETA